MIILNNCIDCGRVPGIQVIYGGNHAAICKCGKAVVSDFKIWSREVAADMWNRANPVFNIDFIDVNVLAHIICRQGLKPFIDNRGELQFRGEVRDGFVASKNIMQMVHAQNDDLTAFYKSRLEPA